MTHVDVFHSENTSLFVVGLRPLHTESQLRQHFAQYGAVVECRIPRDRTTGETRNFGFVTFQEAADVSRALTECTHFIEGYPVQVKLSIQKSKKKKKKTEEEKEKKKEKRKENKEMRKQKMIVSASTK